MMWGFESGAPHWPIGYSLPLTAWPPPPERSAGYPAGSEAIRDEILSHSRLEWGWNAIVMSKSRFGTLWREDMTQYDVICRNCYVKIKIPCAGGGLRQHDVICRNFRVYWHIDGSLNSSSLALEQVAGCRCSADSGRVKTGYLTIWSNG
jgi:hypothetical protein